MAKFAVPDFTRRRQVATRASLIGSPDSGARLSSLFDALASAQREIDVVSPFLDDKLLWALSAISHGGVHVRLVTAPHSQTVRDETYSRDHVNVAWRSARNLHSKKIVIDRTLAIYGSANLTVPSWRQCNEQVVVSTDTEMVTAICKSFDEIWNASINVDDNGAGHITENCAHASH
jgi:phosphatidylserine/phosphatidylglycerophosphate/cardiolipin synthase-like enzyme